MQPYATGSVSLGSAEEPYDSDMTHSYRLTEGRLIRYPLTRIYERGLATNRSSPAPLSEHGIGLDKQEVHPDNAHCSMARHPVQEVDLHSIG